MGDFKGLLRRFSGFFVRPQIETNIASNEELVELELNNRVALVQPYFELGYWVRQASTAVSDSEAIKDYLQSSGGGFNPHPLFDEKYYLAQISNISEPKSSLLEHYILEGVALGIDPSPFFSTSFYLNSYPDIKAAGVNPLLHYIHSGIHEGRESGSIATIISSDFNSGFSDSGWSNDFEAAYHSVRLSSRGDFRGALKLLKSVKRRMPLVFYVKILGLCVCLAGRLGFAKAIFKRLSDTPGVLDADKYFLQALTQAGAIAEGLGDVDAAYKNYLLAAEFGYDIASDSIYRLGLTCFSSGRIEQGFSLVKLSGLITDDFDVSIIPISPVSPYCERQNWSYFELFPTRAMQGASLRFLNRAPSLVSLAGGLEAPAFYFALLQDCVALSKANMVLSEGQFLFDGVTHSEFSRSVVGDSHDGLKLVLSTYGSKALVQLPKKQASFTESGLMMFGVQSNNYGHWFLEFLPRMLVFDSDVCPEHLPIYVNAGMPQTHLESLELLNSKKRPIVILQPNKVMGFSQLGVAPVPAYFPLDVQEGHAYDTVWPADIFSALKNRILQALDAQGEQSPTTPNRIFLSRRSFSSRQLVNESEVENYLRDQGFTTIYPETMTFSEQVNVFRSASIVLGSCSSALTNAIFCGADARIVALINDCTDFNFRGYSSFIEAGGAKIMFVQGETNGDQWAVHRYHRNYTVSIADIQRALDWAVE